MAQNKKAKAITMPLLNKFLLIVNYNNLSQYIYSFDPENIKSNIVVLTIFH